MNASDKVRAFPDIDVIFITPFNPFVVSVKVFHFCTTSIACAICFAWHRLASLVPKLELGNQRIQSIPLLIGYL